MSESSDRRSDLAVMGANEYKNKRRLERILDAHDNVEDRASEAYEHYVQGNISSDARNIILLRAVQQYIREIHTLLMDYSENLDGDQQNIYWEGREQSPLGKIDFSHRAPVWFYGLRDIHTAKEVYTETWKVEENHRHGTSKTRVYSEEYTVPEAVTWNAYTLANMFLADQHDLEIQFEEIDAQRPETDWRDDDDV